MIGQNFFNFIDFYSKKLLLYIEKRIGLADTNFPETSNYGDKNIGSTVKVWVCHYRERINNLDSTISDQFIFSSEKKQNWSKWKYGLPTKEVYNLKYVPTKQPDFSYLGRTYFYNDRSGVFYTNESQDILSISKDWKKIAQIKSSYVYVDNHYFLFKNNQYRDPIFVRLYPATDHGLFYFKYVLENINQYTLEEINFYRSFQFPKFTWRKEEFLTYYDWTKHRYWPYVSGSVQNKFMPRYTSEIRHLYTGNKAIIPDFENSKIDIVDIFCEKEMMSSCYIISDDNQKIFEIGIYPIDIYFSYNTIYDTVNYNTNIPTVGFVEYLNEGYLKINGVSISKYSTAFKNLSSLACMEYLSYSDPMRYIEPFIFMGGVLPVNLKWNAHNLEETGTTPNINSYKLPVSIEYKKPTSNENYTYYNKENNIYYNFDYSLNKTDNNFNTFPNAENLSYYKISKKLVPTPTLIVNQKIQK